MERISDPSYRRKIMILAATTLLAAVVMPVVPNANADPPVVSFLLKPGEVRGFAPRKAQVFRTVSAVRNAAGERPTRPEIGRYEEEGFVEAAIVRLHDRTEPAAKGISSVFEFETAAGARAEMEAELKEVDPRALRKGSSLKYFTLRHFKVPEVPKAVGFAFVSNKAAARIGRESGIAKGLFVEGNCLLAVGVFRLRSREVVEPVRGGVRAIFNRSGGICP
jgi:hypothetical protein